VSSPESKSKVLLVDDEPRILSSLQRTLRKEGYELLIAGDAESALEQLRLHRDVRLVVSDQRMPGRAGTALLGEVARRWPKTERVLLSGWTGEIPEAEIAAASLFAILAKPWDDDELKSTIARAVSRASAA
jgi:DNA-binding NtrC family response regulator